MTTNLYLHSQLILILWYEIVIEKKEFLCAFSDISLIDKYMGGSRGVESYSLGWIFFPPPPSESLKNKTSIEENEKAKEKEGRGEEKVIDIVVNCLFIR